MKGFDPLQMFTSVYNDITCKYVNVNMFNFVYLFCPKLGLVKVIIP